MAFPRGIKLVERETQATVVVVSAVYGWKGDRRLKPTTCHAYWYVLSEDDLHEIHNAGPLLEQLADYQFAVWKKKRKTDDKGQDWSISETWSRDPKRPKPRKRKPPRPPKAKGKS